MIYRLVLLLALIATWLVWSGHFGEDELFIVGLGGVSVLFCWWICLRMRIVDEETVPIRFSWRIIPYGIYLAREIVVSNINVAKIILSPQMELHRNMLYVEARQKTQIGNVILANSITLTPGTVSVSMDETQILVHALSFEGGQEDLSGEMEQQVTRLEGGQPS